MSIGEFARRSRLSPKALRLYDVQPDQERRLEARDAHPHGRKFSQPFAEPAS